MQRSLLATVKYAKNLGNREKDLDINNLLPAPIETNKHLLPWKAMAFGYVRYQPATTIIIDEVFEKNDFYKITKIIINFSDAVRHWNSRKALYLLEAAIDSPLTNKIYKKDFLNIISPITCGSKLSTKRDEMVGSIDKEKEKEQAIARFNKI
jgi:hypothetical protein